MSEQGNPGNARGVDRVLVTAPSPCLTDGTEVVDTPGVGSIRRANTDEAHRSLVTMDIAVLVVAADPPISAADLALLEQARATAARTVVVVNKADRADPEELWEITRFTARALADRFGEPVPVFALSALPDKDTGGTARFADWLTQEIGAAAGSLGVSSTMRALRREIALLEDAQQVERTLLSRDRDARESTVAALTGILDRATDRARAAEDHLVAQSRRLRSVLDDAHDEAVGHALAAAAEILDDGFPGPPRSRPENAAARTRHAMANLAREQATRWYRATADRLCTDQQRTLATLVSDLAQDLSTARSAAGDLLELALGPVAFELPTIDDPPSSFDATVSETWEELLTAALRRRMPRSMRRRRLAAELADWRTAALPRPFGRARAALQQDLRRRTDAGVALLRSAYEDHLAALSDGRDAARQVLREPASPAAADERARRIAEARRLVGA